MTNSGAILTVEGLTVAFGDRPPVVDDVSFTLAPGDRLGVLGLSGSGKSLTALALLGLLPPGARITAGSAIYRAEDGTEADLLRLDKASLRRLRGRELGLVFQEPLTALNPTTKVGQQLREAVRYLRPELKTVEARDKLLGEWLRRVELGEDGPRILAGYPHQLSGGQRQRVLIALALLGEPRILLADEPTTALDALTENEILSLLERLRRELGMSTLFITHDLDVLRRTTDRSLVMAAGRVVHRGSTEEVLALPGAGLGEYQPKSEREQPLGNPRETEAVIEVQDLHVRYAGARPWPWSVRADFPVVNGVSFTVDRGEWIALVGPSGCGKTTVARTLVGLHPPAAGSILGSGRGRTQLIFQDPFSSLNPRHTVRTTLEEVLRIYPNSSLSADGLLNAVGLPPVAYADRRPGQLSGGQRQRVAIARALAASPELLIADEAVSALDAPLRAGVLDLLDDLRRRNGFGLLFISHDLRLVRERADRVLIMDGGVIVEQGTPAAVFARSQSALGRRLVSGLASGS